MSPDSLKSFEGSLRGEKLRKWFESTYGRSWAYKEELKPLISFKEKFEKEHSREPTMEEEQEFLKKLMSDSDVRQNK